MHNRGKTEILIIIAIMVTLAILEIFHLPGLILSLGVSYWIMDSMGRFNPLETAVAASENDGLTERQIEFRRKAAAGKKESNSSFNIVIVNLDGSEATISFDANSNITVEGNPDPRILAAAQGLSSDTINSGPDAIYKEIQRIVIEGNPKNDDET